MSVEDDDRPTVVLDLNALKKEKLKQEEDLANIVEDLEFAVGPIETESSPALQTLTPTPTPVADAMDAEIYAEKFLDERSKSIEEEKRNLLFPVILFDFNSDFFHKTKRKFPQGFDYHIAKNLNDLNKFLTTKKFQIVVFNYDVNPKAVNQLTAQIKKKFPTTKTMIMAKSISTEKAKAHSKTPSGASGYYQFPLEAKKIEEEFLKIYKLEKKVS